MPRVTVVTPAHNSADTIVAAIESVRSQGYRDHAHVVVDDASSDDTAVLVESAAADDPRLRLIRSPVNVGPAGARNIALREIDTELVALLDADDALLPEYLEKLVSLYDAGRSAGRRVGVIACNAYLETEHGRLSETWLDRHGTADGAGVTELLRGNPVFISAVVPHDALAEVGGFSTECWGSEDHDLWLRLAEAGYEIVATREPLVAYRLAEGSVSASQLGMAVTTQATYRRALERGRLDGRQRRLARAALRTARAAEAFERLAAGRARSGSLPAMDVVRALPAFASAGLTQPARWPHWARLLRRRVLPSFRP